MSWKTLIIKESEKLYLFLNNVIIKKDTYEYRFAITDLNAILFENYKTTITTRLINKLAEYKVLLIFCDQNLIPVSVVQPFKGHHKQLEIINSQLNWTKEQKLIIWTNIVKFKLLNQIEVIKMTTLNLKKTKLLYSYIDEIQLGDFSNKEGHAAKVYFRELFGNEFRREEENYINSALNYGYAIITNAFIRTICSKRLHPSIAIFHHNMFDAHALADDLMEPFRPIVDYWVVKNMKNRDYFSRNDKLELINLLNSKISFQKKELYLTNAINNYVDEIMNYFNSNIEFTYPIISTLKFYEL